MRRDWNHARAKVDSERVCRVCGSRDRVEAAHTIGRKHDRPAVDGVNFGVPTNLLVVNPLDIVPLCGEHHRAYDNHALDLLPYLTHDEQASAVRHVGIVAALRRTTSTRI